MPRGAEGAFGWGNRRDRSNLRAKGRLQAVSLAIKGDPAGRGDDDKDRPQLHRRRQRRQRHQGGRPGRPLAVGRPLRAGRGAVQPRALERDAVPPGGVLARSPAPCSPCDALRMRRPSPRRRSLSAGPQPGGECAWSELQEIRSPSGPTSPSARRYRPSEIRGPGAIRIGDIYCRFHPSTPVMRLFASRRRGVARSPAGPGLTVRPDTF